MDEVHEEKEVLSYDEEMASGTNIEKSIGTQHQEQSSAPANFPAKTFIPIDQRKWNDIFAVKNKRDSLAWRVSKIVTNVSRHRGLPVTHVTAAILKMKMLKDARIHNGWIQNIEEAARKDFSIAWIRTVISSVYVPSKVIQEESWLIPHCWTMLKMHLDGKCFYHVGGSLAMNPTRSIKIYRNNEVQYKR